MSNEKFFPQIDAEQTGRDVRKARYAAYMQYGHRLVKEAEADKAGRGRSGMGGAAV